MSECVYRHTTPDGRVYIGIAQEPAHLRWANGNGYRNNRPFWECIREVGWDNITHEILATGLDRYSARKLELELIREHGCLYPDGFNRRADDGRSRIRRKKEVGVTYGYCEVLDYWPDKDRYKVYRLRCKCGSEFLCHVFDLVDNINCGCLNCK